MRPGPTACILLAAVVALAGCLQGDPGPSARTSTSTGPNPPAAESSSSATSSTAHASTTTSTTTSPADANATDQTDPVPSVSVVVADVGPGANPYHLRHQRPGWTQHPSTRVPGLPADLPSLDLSFSGDQAADLAADHAVWATYAPGQVYWVPETNLLLLTLESYAGHVDGIADGYNLLSVHGTATADAIGQACPGCYVLVIQDWGNIDGGAMQAIADDLPWVDFATSTSFAFQTPEYVGAAQTEGYAKATRALWDRGGLAFAPTGNGIVTPNAQWVVVCGVGCVSDYSLHFVNLPPWVVMVGGSEPECNGVPFDASKPAELVSDYTQVLATQEGSNETTRIAGTSFSTPRAAGLFGQALLTIRQTLTGSRGDGALWNGPPGPAPWLHDGHLTNEELREAFHQAAGHFTTNDFDVNCLGQAGPVPVSPSPWIEMGWGHLGADEAAETARLILEGTTVERDATTTTGMDAVQALRETLYPW